MARTTNPGKDLQSVFVGGESDTMREIPPEFRAALRLIVDETPVPNDRDIEALDGSQILASKIEAKQTGEKVRRTTRKPVGNVVLTEKFTDKNRQVGTRTRTFKPVGDSVASPTAVQEVETKNLGNEFLIEDVMSVPILFDEKMRQAGTPLVIPERFRAAAGVNTSEDLIAGTVPDTVALGSGEVERQETQQSVFTKKTRVTSFDPLSAPTLHGQEYDERLNVIAPYTETLEASGTSLGQPLKKIDPLSDQVDLVRTIDISAATAFFDTYFSVLPGSTRVEFPPVLETLDFSIEQHTGSGDAQTDDASGFWSGSGSFVVQIHSEAQFSRTVMPNLVGVFAPERGSHRYLTTKKVTFLLPSPVTEADVLSKLTDLLGVSVLAWPNFNPQEVVGKFVGREGSARVTADAHIHDGGSDSGAEHSQSAAKAYSIEVGMTIRETRLRPSIHGSFLSTSEYGTEYVPFSQDITAVAGPLYSGFGTVDAEVSTATLTEIDPTWTIYNTGATPGDTSIPTDGVRLLRTESELYRYGYVMIQAEVLDFAGV